MTDIQAPIDWDFRPTTEAELAACLADPLWRIGSGYLYKIMVKSEDTEQGFVIPFRPNGPQRDFMNSLHYLNVILKARQLGFCVSGETRILTADMRWRRADEIAVGDEIVSVDEMTPGGKGQHRKMRTAVVEAVASMVAQTFKITFDDGRSVTCTDRHPWLSKKAGCESQWRSLSGRGNNVVGKLKVGTKVRWITKPWSDGDIDDGWMGGILDGEGSISKPRSSGVEINASQRPGAVWDRMLRYSASRGYSARVESDDTYRLTKHGDTPVPKLCFSRMDEIFRLVGQTRPSRFLGKKFWEGKELPGKRTGEGWSSIISIEPQGEHIVYDIQTSTKTYIAEGFVSHNSTLICIIWLDHALFNPNQRCGIIAQSLPAAEGLFRDKIKFAFDNLPPDIKRLFPLKTDSVDELLFAHNNSSIRVATSMRSGTIHRLHVSELGKISKERPGHAHEIITGSLPAVPSTGITVIESTAEGAAGAFYDISQRAQAIAEAGRMPSRAEWMFHFFPWWREAGYHSADLSVPITAAEHAYFDSVQREMGTKITLAQRAWYIQYRETNFGGDTEKMWQEMPSTPEECWQKSTEGTYFARQISATRAQGRITTVPHVEHVPVHTFWDIGSGDGTGIWLMQIVGTQDRFLRYIEGWGESYSHFVKELRDTGYLFGGMYLPHDATQVRQLQYKIGSPLQMLQELAPDWTFHIVPRIHSLQAGIEMTRQRFSQAWFDEAGTKEGRHHLGLYRKKWNKAQGCFVEEPEKLDGHSEAADSFRQWAQIRDHIASHTFARSPQRQSARRASGMTA